MVSTTTDAFLGGRVLISQPARGYRSGIDAVLLAAACPAKPGDNVLEAGCGVGVASLCLAARVRPLSVTGIDIEPSFVALARANAEANAFAESAHFIESDIAAPWGELEAKGLFRESFDHVMANPPFYAADAARLPKEQRRARAHVMEKDGLDRWLRFLAATCKNGGTATLIHTAAALSEVLSAFDGRFGALAVRPVYAKPGESAIRIIVSGIKGSRAPLAIAPSLTLQDATGAPSAVAQALAREGAALM